MTKKARLHQQQQSSQSGDTILREVNKMEQEDKEKVLVPVRRQAIPNKELSEELPEPGEVKVQEMPRRWYIY